MNLSEFRLEMRNYWQAVDTEAKSFKDSDLVREKLHALYEKFDASERQMADEIISEWVSSENEALRFDALVLVDDFKIVVAIPTLRDLASRLASSEAPEAPYELKKVTRILGSIDI